MNVDILFLEKLDVLHSDVSTSSNVVRNAFDEKNVIICANNMKYSAILRIILMKDVKEILIPLKI